MDRQEHMKRAKGNSAPTAVMCS